MIEVSIYINGRRIFNRSARNVGRDSTYPKNHRYLLEDSSEIMHRREKGAVALAIEMLKTPVMKK